jgi:hypothetical protein
VGGKESGRTGANDVFGLKVESTKLFGRRRRNWSNFEFLWAVVAAVADTGPSFTLLLVFAVGRIGESDDRVDMAAVGAFGTRGIGPDDARHA